MPYKLNPFTGQLDRVSDPAIDLLIPNVVCDSSVYVGAAIYVDSMSVAYNAMADSASTSNVLGIVELKSNSTLCSVRVLGVSSDIYSSLDVTRDYYLSDVTPGLITTTPILDVTGHVVIKLGQPFSDTRFLMMKGTPFLKA